MLRGLMTDDEWAIVAPFLTTASLRGGRPPANHRRVLDGILWICRTGTPWRDLGECQGSCRLNYVMIPSIDAAAVLAA